MNKKMFVIWWGSKTYQRNIASESIECPVCGTTRMHTYRLYEIKTKIYSIIPAGTSKHMTLICHGCLTEQKLGRIHEKELIQKFDVMEKNKMKKQVDTQRTLIK
jgi:hypothetical protein